MKCGGRETWKGEREGGREEGRGGGYLDGDPSGSNHSQTAVVELLKDEVGQEPVRLSIRPRLRERERDPVPVCACGVVALTLLR